MPSRTNDSGLRAAISVSQMARMLQLSRAAFYVHVKQGHFLAPIYSTGTRRPIYTEQMQRHIGASHCRDGLETMQDRVSFYRYHAPKRDTSIAHFLQLIDGRGVGCWTPTLCDA